jgi:exodeoxyribonuclease VII small subunit
LTPPGPPGTIVYRGLVPRGHALRPIQPFDPTFRHKTRLGTTLAARKRSSKARSATESGKLKFEAALDRLENLVDTLEQGDLELEESLEVFEEGVSLSKQCAKELESVERRIEVLIQEGGEWLSRSFEADESNAADQAPEHADQEAEGEEL